MKVLEDNLESHQKDKGKTKSGRKLKTKNIQWSQYLTNIKHFKGNKDAKRRMQSHANNK